jgi:hypothetical protein
MSHGGDDGKANTTRGSRGFKASDAGLPAMVSLKGGRSLLWSSLYLFLFTLADSEILLSR